MVIGSFGSTLVTSRAVGSRLGTRTSVGAQYYRKRIHTNFESGTQFPAPGVTTISSPERVELDKNGAISIVLAANNDPSTTPSGTTYRVQEDLTGQTTIAYNVIVPYNAAGGTVNLATLAPVTTERLARSRTGRR